MPLLLFSAQPVGAGVSLWVVGWRRRSGKSDVDPLRRELALQDALVRAVRRDLYSIEPRYRRSRATTALAAAVAERTYWVTSERPDLHNEAPEEWRGHLQRVWLWLAGDEQHRRRNVAPAGWPI